MSHFIVTFRLKNDSTYSDRYSSFVDAVRNVATGSKWEETSSFFAFGAEGTAASICNTIYLKSDFDASKDQMLVIDLDNRKKETKGPIEYPNSLQAALGF